MGWIKKHLISYRYAWKGIVLVFRKEIQMRYHLVAAIAVIVLNVVLDISREEWLITLILISLAWMAEIFNTAVEKLADRVCSEEDALIGQVKDMAAGAVLIICIMAVVCACIIYFPYLLR